MQISKQMLIARLTMLALLFVGKTTVLGGDLLDNSHFKVDDFVTVSREHLIFFGVSESDLIDTRVYFQESYAMSTSHISSDLSALLYLSKFEVFPGIFLGFSVSIGNQEWILGQFYEDGSIKMSRLTQPLELMLARNSAVYKLKDSFDKNGLPYLSVDLRSNLRAVVTAPTAIPLRDIVALKRIIASTNDIHRVQVYSKPCPHYLRFDYQSLNPTGVYSWHALHRIHSRQFPPDSALTLPRWPLIQGVPTFSPCEGPLTRFEKKRRVYEALDHHQ